MARIRTIKPEFFTSEHVGTLSPHARLLFIGLWTVADREGRLEDRPIRLRAQLLPYDTIDAEALVAEIAGAGFIDRYAVDGEKYIQIKGFTKHQRPNVKEPPSSIPVPSTEKTRRARKETGEHENFRAGTSGSGEWISGSGEREREGEGKKIQMPDRAVARKRSPITPTEYPEDFCKAWESYPRKDGKSVALEAFISAGRPLDAILSALKWQAPLYRQRPPDKVPHFSTYLNQRRWEDEPPQPSSTSMLSEKTQGNIAAGLEWLKGSQ